MSFHCTQRIETENVRRPLPDREHLRIAQQPWEPRILHVSSTAECFESFACNRYRLLRGVKLGHRNQESKQLRLGLGCCTALVRSQQLDDAKRQMKRGAELQLHVGQRLEVQRML